MGLVELHLFIIPSSMLILTVVALFVRLPGPVAPDELPWRQRLLLAGCFASIGLASFFVAAKMIQSMWPGGGSVMLRPGGWKMGVDASLEDEDGHPSAVIDDPNGLFVMLLSLARDEGPVCLQFIDPYGDTTFNNLQMAALIPELEAAIAMVTDESIREHGLSVLRLARSCREGVHLYLKFIGD